MQITPRVFVSAATSDLKTARSVVNSVLNELECLPVDQAHFGTQCGDVRGMLREKIAGCQAVVHLVGRDFGQEPGDRAPGAPRRSWTQTEYDLALQLGKKLYVIVCDATYPFEPRPQPEPADSTDLQARHMEAVLKGKHLWHRVRNVEELRGCLLRLKLPLDEVRTELRRRQVRQRLVAAVAAGVAVLAFNWLVLRLAALGATVEETARNIQGTIETTGASVTQTIEVGQQEQGVRFDRQSDQLELVKLGLQELAIATRELKSQLDDGADRTALIALASRHRRLLDESEPKLDDARIPVSAVRLIRDAKVVSKRATLQLEEYRLNPPDVLWIEGVNLVPRTGTYQPISGEHLIGPDGRVTLGTYGQLAVAGMTVPAAKAAIEEHLAESFDQPQVAVSVYGYNSMVTYVVYVEGESTKVYRLPFFGKGTVMDAVALIGNVFGRVEQMALTNPQVPTLEVDWPAILNGDTSTDYPLLPDDRLVILLQGSNGGESASDVPPPELRTKRPELSPYLNLLGK